MNWTDLVSEVAARTGTSVSSVRDVLATFEATAQEALSRGESVRIPALGTVDAKWRSARTVRSIADQRSIFINGRYVPTFRPSASLRRVLEDRTPQYWRDASHQEAWRLADTLVDDLLLYHDHLAPKVTDGMAPEALESACAASFGPMWDRVVETYENSVPSDVRAGTHYLGIAVQQRLANA